MNDAFFAGMRRENSDGPRVKRLQKADQLLRGLLPVQRNIFDDPSDRISILTPGQAGKTTVFGRLVVDKLLRKRQALIAYVSLTQKVAKRYLWETLNAINDEHGLGLEPHNTDGYFRAPDGGLAFFGGIESADDVERYRGTPWDLFILDETKSANQKLVEVLVEEVLPPRLATRGGKLILGGTPGAILHGKFFGVTGQEAFLVRGDGDERRAISRPYRNREEERWQGILHEWSFHHWELEENTAMPHLWLAALDRKKKKGWSDDNPIWLREYRGQWVADDTNRLYRFNPERNLWLPNPKSRERFGLPQGHDWLFVIGVDFGHSDPFAVEIVAFSDTHPDLFQVWEYNKAGLSIRQQAGVIAKAQELCGDRLIAVVGDPARRHILASLRIDHGIYVHEAEKREKRDAVELASADFFEGRVKVLRDSTLHAQVASLQWDESGKLDVGTNDASDAFLYAHRRAQHRIANVPMQGPRTPAENQAELDELELQAIAAQERDGQDDDADRDPFGQVMDVDWGDDDS